MQQQSHPTAEGEAQSQELRVFLGWLIAIAVLAAAADLALYAFVREPILLALSASSVAGLLGILAARLTLARSGPRPAVYIAAGVMLVLTVVFVALAPALLPLFVLMPVLTVATALPYLDSRGLLLLSGVSLLVGAGLAPLAALDPLRIPVPPQVGAYIMPLMLPLIMAAVLALLWQFHRRLTRALDQAEDANSALRAAQAGLEGQIAVRTADLRSALAEIESRSDAQTRLLAELEQQRQAIGELSVPVLPVARGVLVLPLVGAMDEERLQQLFGRALEAVERSRARRVLIDVTGVPVVDTQVARGLVQTVRAVRLLGAQAILVGMRPEVAQTIVSLGVDLEARTYADLETALESEAGRRASR